MLDPILIKCGTVQYKGRYFKRNILYLVKKAISNQKNHNFRLTKGRTGPYNYSHTFTPAAVTARGLHLKFTSSDTAFEMHGVSYVI